MANPLCRRLANDPHPAVQVCLLFALQPHVQCQHSQPLACANNGKIRYGDIALALVVNFHPEQMQCCASNGAPVCQEIVLPLERRVHKYFQSLTSSEGGAETALLLMLLS